MNNAKKAALVIAAVGFAAVAGAGSASASSEAEAAAVGSPGVISGNVIQVPIHIPINICNNPINAPGVLNPAFGNTCANIDAKSHSSYDAEHFSKNMRFGGEHREGGEHRRGEERGENNGGGNGENNNGGNGENNNGGGEN